MRSWKMQDQNCRLVKLRDLVFPEKRCICLKYAVMVEISTLKHTAPLSDTCTKITLLKTQRLETEKNTDVKAVAELFYTVTVAFVQHTHSHLRCSRHQQFCVCLGLPFCVFFWFSLGYFVFVLFVLCQEIVGRTSPK